jgi:hypothetical protein
MKAAFKDINFRKPTLALIAQADQVLDEYQAKGLRVTLRQLYYFEGEGLQLDGQALNAQSVATLRGPHAVALRNGAQSAQLLLLQARPIGEPVAQHGPFVMNTQAEIHQAFADYRRTEFGGWPWPKRDPVHPRSAGRFARHADGQRDERDGTQAILPK